MLLNRFNFLFIMFDLHWHARDLGQKAKETVKHSLDLAYAAGLSGIAAMPNTDPPLIDLESCREYLALAREAEVPETLQDNFYVHIGLTPDLEQVKRAVEAYHQEPKIIGLKAFWGKSTGNLSIVNRDDQVRVLEALVREGYEGVVVGHFEKESEMNNALYNPQNPRTWSTSCRPERAEISSFVDIFKMAAVAGFKGTLHVAHVSTLEVANTVFEYMAKSNLDPYSDNRLKFSCGVTPHHLFLDYTYLDDLKTARWYKCNPPLRSPETSKGLLERLLDGRIPIMESDHAPHTFEDKRGEMPASGIVSGGAWAYLPGQLQKLGMSRERVEDVLHNNAVRLFGLGEMPNNEPDFEKLESLMQYYPFDPFKGVFE